MHPNAIALDVDLGGCHVQYQQAVWPRRMSRE